MESTIGSAARSALACGHPQSPASGERLRDLVLRCLLLDTDIGPFSTDPRFNGHPSRDPAIFFEVLRSTISEFGLGPLFAWNAEGAHHRVITPRAYNRSTGAVIGNEMMQWRADYRGLAPERQMLAATIIWMYQQGPDSTWLRRVPCTWTSGEALNYLNDAGCLANWLVLVATCPGW